MNDQLITFVTAKLAKKKEFDESVNDYYIIKTGKLLVLEWQQRVSTKLLIKAPTQTSLHRYLREKYKYFIEVKCYFDDVWRAEIFHVRSQSEDLDYKPIEGWFFDGKTPEKVLEQGLRKILRLIK